MEAYFAPLWLMDCDDSFLVPQQKTRPIRDPPATSARSAVPLAALSTLRGVEEKENLIHYFFSLIRPLLAAGDDFLRSLLVVGVKLLLVPYYYAISIPDGSP